MNKITKDIYKNTFFEIFHDCSLCDDVIELIYRFYLDLQTRERKNKNLDDISQIIRLDYETDTFENRTYMHQTTYNPFVRVRPATPHTPGQPPFYSIYTYAYRTIFVYKNKILHLLNDILFRSSKYSDECEECRTAAYLLNFMIMNIQVNNQITFVGNYDWVSGWYIRSDWKGLDQRTDECLEDVHLDYQYELCHRVVNQCLMNIFHAN